MGSGYGMFYVDRERREMGRWWISTKRGHAKMEKKFSMHLRDMKVITVPVPLHQCLLYALNHDFGVVFRG